MAVPIDTSVAHDGDTKASTAVKWITVDIFNKNGLTDFNIPLLSSAVSINPNLHPATSIFGHNCVGNFYENVLMVYALSGANL